MTTTSLDRIDRRILAALQSNGRLSNAELADSVGLSPSPCWQRKKRLEQDGYIRTYTAVLDQARLGLPETVFVEITLDHHDEATLESFGRALSEIPEVLEVYLTTGEYDYLLKVAVNGTSDYETFLRQRLYHVKGIRQSRSTFTLRCLKSGRLPISTAP